MNRTLFVIAVSLTVVLDLGGCSARPTAGGRTPVAPPVASPSPSGADPNSFLATVPRFAPILLSGTDNRILGWTLPPGVPALMTVSYQGSGNLALTSLNGDGTQQGLLVSAHGPYAGTTAVGLRATPVSLRIETVGPWAIRLRPLSDGRVWNGTSPLTGTGDDVVMISPSTANPVSAIVTNSSSQIFTLSASTADEDSLLVNEEGEFNGTVQIPGAAVLISVHTDGTWSVTAR